MLEIFYVVECERNWSGGGTRTALSRKSRWAWESGFLGVFGDGEAGVGDCELVF